MRTDLSIGLILVILWHILSLVISFARSWTRVAAFSSAIVFSLYLLTDFNHLAQLDTIGLNDWVTATEMAMHIHLDVLNLMLEILEMMD